MRAILLVPVLATVFCAGPVTAAETVLFEDSFKTGLSEKWQVVGLDKKDYRVKDDGLEMRVQVGKPKNPPMLKVVVPFEEKGILSASVTITLLDEFTTDGECAGLYLTTNGSREFSAEKKRVKGNVVFSPGKHVFKGKKGEEGNRDSYDVIYTEATKDPLRIIAQGNYGFFQVGPSAKGEYQTFFHSILKDEVKERGFSLAACGAPEKANHWVRFSEFKVVKQ